MGRRLGQHFLSDPAILDRIVAAIEPQPDDVVLEIGSGEGTLTRRLAPKVGEVVAIERDARLAARLREDGRRETEESTLSNVRIVEADALELDWTTLASSVSRLSFKIIGNIPYYLTSPLIEKALTPPLPRVVVFLVQKEFADRVTAGPGSKTYGALSAGVQAVAQVERLFTVRAGAFRPPPKVDSAVVRFIPRPVPLVAPDEHPAFRSFLAKLFSQRRKQLGRSLRAVTGAPKESIERLLQGAGIDAERRPEVLRPEQLVDLFRRAESLTLRLPSN